MKHYNKVVAGILVLLISAGIISGVGAVIKVNVLEEKYKSMKEMIIEIKNDVRWIRKTLDKET